MVSGAPDQCAGGCAHLLQRPLSLRDHGGGHGELRGLRARRREQEERVVGAGRRRGQLLQQRGNSCQPYTDHSPLLSHAFPPPATGLNTSAP